MLNTITIMGRLTRDPELRRTSGGVAVANFRVAVDRDFQTNGEKKTDFIDCVAWRQTGEFVSKYLSKGRMVVVSGRLEMREWTDKDGSKRVSAEINADNVYFADSKNAAENASSSPTAAYAAPAQNYAAPVGNPAAFAGYAAAPAAPAYAAPAAGSFAPIDYDDGELPF